MLWGHISLWEKSANSQACGHGAQASLPAPRPRASRQGHCRSEGTSRTLHFLSFVTVKPAGSLCLPAGPVEFEGRASLLAEQTHVLRGRPWVRFSALPTSSRGSLPPGEQRDTVQVTVVLVSDLRHPT